MSIDCACVSVCVCVCVCGGGITGHQHVMITGAYSALEFFKKIGYCVYSIFILSLSLIG